MDGGCARQTAAVLCVTVMVVWDGRGMGFPQALKWTRRSGITMTFIVQIISQNKMGSLPHAKKKKMLIF